MFVNAKTLTFTICSVQKVNALEIQRPVVILNAKLLYERLCSYPIQIGERTTQLKIFNIRPQ